MIPMTSSSDSRGVEQNLGSFALERKQSMLSGYPRPSYFKHPEESVEMRMLAATQPATIQQERATNNCCVSALCSSRQGCLSWLEERVYSDKRLDGNLFLFLQAPSVWRPAL